MQEDTRAVKNWINNQPPDAFKAFLESPSENSPIEYLQNLADKGDPRAQLFLSLRCWMGDGISKENEKAFFYCNKAAGSGFIPALYFLSDFYCEGVGTSRNGLKSVELLEQASKSGFRPAIHDLAVNYVTGEFVSRDLDRAFALYKEAAELGYPPSMHNLATCYWKGRGIAIDKELALKWAIQAADCGIPDSYFLVATLSCEKGDLDKFIVYLKKSAKAKDPLGVTVMVTCYAQGNYVQPKNPQNQLFLKLLMEDFSEEELFSLAKEAVDTGCPPAQESLAACYRYGIGTAIDYRKAYVFYGVTNLVNPASKCQDAIKFLAGFLTSDEKQLSDVEIKASAATFKRQWRKDRMSPDDYAIPSSH